MVLFVGGDSSASDSASGDLVESSKIEHGSVGADRPKYLTFV